MNGADDVVRYDKFADVGPQYRMIVLGRPGYTEKALAGARQADLEAGYLVMGPELPDISSSAAREALARGDRARAAALLHPAVLAWCEEHGPWRAATLGAEGNEAQWLVLVRHGDRQDYATPAWRQRIMALGRYPRDPPLSTLGHRQARQLGAAAAATLGRRGGTVRVLTSPYLRCLQTITPLCDA